MSVVVAEEGNRRVGDMTDDEVDQCVSDIKAWFQRGKYCENIDGAASSLLQRLVKTLDLPLPRSLQTFLSSINGGIYYFDKKSLSVTDICDIRADLDKSREWRESFIPIFGDQSSLIVIDVNQKNAVFEWESDDGLGEKIHTSFSSFLEAYRNVLLGGHCEFIPDVGVVESMTSKSRK